MPSTDKNDLPLEPMPPKSIDLFLLSRLAERVEEWARNHPDNSPLDRKNITAGLTVVRAIRQEMVELIRTPEGSD